MTARQKFPVSSSIAGASLLALAVTFSACVPQEPPAPTPKTRLYFVTKSEDGARQILNQWNPETRQLIDVTLTTNNGGLNTISAQPNGSVVLFSTFAIAPTGVATGGFYTIDENDAGRYVRRLVASNGGAPTWSRDGTHLAGIDGSDNLYVSPVPGTRTLVAKARDFTWSPDSGKIVYTSPFGTPLQLHVYDVATGQAIEVADSSYGLSGNISTQWLSDNRHIIVSSYDGDSRANHIIVDSTAPAPAAYRNIVTGIAGSSSLTASPDNDRFIVQSYGGSDESRALSLAFADGRPPVPFATASTVIQPVWSPDGNHIYYTADVGNDGLHDMVVADAEGQTQRSVALNLPVTSDPPTSYVESFRAPGTDKFAFIQTGDALASGGDVQLKVIDLPSGDLHSFAPVQNSNVNHMLHAAWSPNGRYLLWGNSAWYMYDSNSPDAPSHSFGTSVASAGVWSRNSTHFTLRRTNGNTVAVATITASGITIDDYPFTSISGSLWTGSKND